MNSALPIVKRGKRPALNSADVALLKGLVKHREGLQAQVAKLRAELSSLTNQRIAEKFELTTGTIENYIGAIKALEATEEH